MSAITKNTGAVPLISFGLDWNASDPLHVILDGDAAVGPAGRAEDVFLGLGWAFDPTARLTLGWRILEGEPTWMSPATSRWSTSPRSGSD